MAEALKVWLISGDDNFVRQLLVILGIKEIQRKEKIFSKMNCG